MNHLLAPAHTRPFVPWKPAIKTDQPDADPIGLCVLTLKLLDFGPFQISQGRGYETRTPSGMKKIAILQSNYIPWKGYFDLIAAVDEFVIFDDMQYTRRDWRNRNKIKTPQGLKWLTVPVKQKGRYLQPIRDTEILGADWSAEHWKSLVLNYGRTEHFDTIATVIEPLYQDSYSTITELNLAFLHTICKQLGITTTITHSWDYEFAEGKSARLADICRQADADVYVSGPAAKNYLDEKAFTDEDVKVQWFDYEDYREYPQLWGPFEHGVTILDLLFNCGAEAPRHMRFVS